MWLIQGAVMNHFAKNRYFGRFFLPEIIFAIFLPMSCCKYKTKEILKCFYLDSELKTNCIMFWLRKQLLTVFPLIWHVKISIVNHLISVTKAAPRGWGRCGHLRWGLAVTAAFRRAASAFLRCKLHSNELLTTRISSKGIETQAQNLNL